MAELHFNVGDRLTPIRLQLRERDGTAKDISGHTVAFSMYDVLDESVQVNAGACVLTNGGTDGKAHYDWGANDLAEGVYWGYFKTTLGGVYAQYPQDGRTLRIVVHTVP